MHQSLFTSFTCFALLVSQAHAGVATGIELQKEADQRREKGESLEAIALYNQALVQFQEAGDYPSVLETLVGRFLAWKHLFYKTQDSVYAILIKNDVRSMQEIAQAHQLLDKSYILHFLQGTAATLLEEYALAEEELAKAIALYPADNAQKGDWIAHLGDIQYRNGKKDQGKATLLQGIQIMKEKASDVGSFELNVWLSGAYLRLAKLLLVDNPPESTAYLHRAKEIIEADDRLVIRKQQLESFPSN